MKQVCYISQPEYYHEAFSSISPNPSFKLLVHSDLKTFQKSNDLAIDILIVDEKFINDRSDEFIKNAKARNPSLKTIVQFEFHSMIFASMTKLEQFDDFITSAMSTDEILLRLEWQFEKQSRNPSNKTIQIGQLKIDLSSREVRKADKVQKLSKKEFDLLRVLAESPNKAFTREELLTSVWGYQTHESHRTIDTHILLLRKKLTLDSIVSIRGVGYLYRNN